MEVFTHAEIDQIVDEYFEKQKNPRSAATKEKEIKTRVEKLMTEDVRLPGNVFKMAKPAYLRLLALVQDETENLGFEEGRTILVDQRLAVTLRYLATGEYQTEGLELPYELEEFEIREMILETCEGMNIALQDYDTKNPESPKEWRDVAKGFQLKTEFPHCLGALGGRYIHITQPSESCGQYVNEQSESGYSIVVQAIVDANGELLMHDFQNMDGIPDGDLFYYTRLFHKFERSQLGVPRNRQICPGGKKLPYVFVTGDAFESLFDIMKPFDHKELSKEEILFNNRANLVRQISDNFFKTFVSRFRALSTVLDFEVEDALAIIRSCFLLYNYIRKHEKNFNDQGLNNVANCALMAPLPVSQTMVQRPEAEQCKKQFAKAMWTFKHGTWRSRHPNAPTNSRH